MELSKERLHRVMSKFPTTQKVNEFITEVVNYKSVKEISELCDQFKREVFYGYELAKFENFKRGSWKKPFEKVRKALKESDLDTKLIEYTVTEGLKANWNASELRDDQGKYKDNAVTMYKEIIDSLDYLNIENTMTTEKNMITESKKETKLIADINLEEMFDQTTMNKINTAIDISGLDQSEFIKRAIKAYASHFKIHNKDVESMTNSELMKSRVKGSGEELVRRAIDGIITYNNDQPEKENRYQISLSILKTLTGCRQNIIQDAMKKYEVKINTHHEHKVSLNPTWNRGKADIKSKISDFRARC